MDKLSAEQRHKNMAAIHSKDTKPEMIVRRGLWSRGFRYRLNHKRLPGRPDIVLRKYRTCIFVNGCFWHGHKVMFDGRGEMEDGIENSACCKIPKTNRAFWVAKIRRNKECDREKQQELARMGWHCITVWECELKPQKREETLDAIAFTLNHIWLQDHGVGGGVGGQVHGTHSRGFVGAMYQSPDTSDASEETEMPMAAEEIKTE